MGRAAFEPPGFPRGLTDGGVVRVGVLDPAAGGRLGARVGADAPVRPGAVVGRVTEPERPGTTVRLPAPPLADVGRRCRVGRAPLRGAVGVARLPVPRPGVTVLGGVGRTARVVPEPSVAVPVRLDGAWTPAEDPGRDPFDPLRSASLGTTLRRGGAMRGRAGFDADGSALRTALRKGGCRVRVRGVHASPTALSLNSKRGRPRRGRE